MRAKTIYETQNFTRGLDPKEAMGIGLQKQIIKALLSLQSENGIGSINFMQNRNIAWLEVTDYNADIDTFLKYIYKNFKIDFFSDTQQKNIRKTFGHWSCKFYLIIKPEYKELFKNAFTPEGFIKESYNFERGLDPKDAMNIGKKAIDLLFYKKTLTELETYSANQISLHFFHSDNTIYAYALYNTFQNLCKGLNPQLALY